MRIVDSHFHWWPRKVMEQVCKRTTFPYAEPNEKGGFTYWFRDGKTAKFNLGPEWYDLDKLFAHMDATGRDFDMIMSTGPFSVHFSELPKDEAKDACIAWNEEWAWAQREYPSRIASTCVVPLQDTQLAVDTLDDAVLRLGLRSGVSMPGSVGLHENIDAERLEPFYDRVEQLGVPLFLHPTDAAFLDVFEGYNGQLYGALGRIVDVSAAAFRLILSGIMERHPNMKVFMSHTGGALPYQAGRLDKNTRPSKLMPEKPSTYLKRMHVDTVSPHSMGVKFAIEYFGEDHVMYGDDYPCWTPEASLDVFEGVEDLSEATREKIFRTNARRFWELDKVSASSELMTATR
jgi:aminocarboxymuconate-semialdehyde decarboxylase